MIFWTRRTTVRKFFLYGSKVINSGNEACLMSLAVRSTKPFNPPSANTLLWVWTQQLLKDWLVLESSFLWISGKAGSGKSTLMKFLEHNPKRLFTTVTADTVVVFFSFYAGSSEPTEKSKIGFFRHLVHELLASRPGWIKDVVKYFNKNLESDNTWRIDMWDESNAKAVFELFLRKDGPMRLVLLVDSFDECEGSNYMLGELLSYLKGLATLEGLSNVSVKICLASRPDLPFDKIFENTATIILEDHTLDDIYAYVEAEVACLKKQCTVSSSTEQIFLSVPSQANGMFLWARLVLEELFERHQNGEPETGSDDALEAALKWLAPDLRILFSRMLADRNKRGNHGAEALAILNIAHSAIRPLTLDEFGTALAFRGPERRFHSLHSYRTSRAVVHDHSELQKLIRSRCGGLIEIRKEVGLDRQEEGGCRWYDGNRGTVTYAVRLIHQSVAEYLGKYSTEVCEALKISPQSVLIGHELLLFATLSFITLVDFNPEWHVFFEQHSVKDEMTGLDSRRRPSYLLQRRSASASVGEALWEELKCLDISSFPFLRYADLYWFRHAKAVSSSSTVWKCAALEPLLKCENSYFDNWWRRAGWKVVRDGNARRPDRAPKPLSFLASNFSDADVDC